MNNVSNYIKSKDRYGFWFESTSPLIVTAEWHYNSLQVIRDYFETVISRKALCSEFHSKPIFGAIWQIHSDVSLQLFPFNVE